MLTDLASSSSNDDNYIKMKIDRMDSPIDNCMPIVIKREQKVKYKTLLIPNGMRSSFWKYFGFPSEDGRTYITKKKVVCALCNSLLAYNKNTTNLKSHLISKHRDVVKKADLVIRSKKEMLKKSKFKPVNIKSEQDKCMSPTPSNIAYEQLTNLSIDGIEFEPGEIPEPNENDNLFIIDDENSCSSKSPTENDNQFDEIQSENNIYTISLITDMIITDLLPISTVCGAGFKNLILNFLPQPFPKPFEIESQINYIVEKRKNTIQNYILDLTKTKQFSIILNKFKTYTQDEFLMIIVNFINIETKIQKDDVTIKFDVSKIDQKCFIYNLVQIHNSEINYDQLFTNFDLNKCISIIYNYLNHSSLIDFLLENNLNNNKIIIVPNFLDIIKNLMKNIFYSNNLEIESIFCQIRDTRSTGNFNHWFNRWMVLENYFTQNSENLDDLSNLVGMLINCLRPLKVTLDLLQNDDIIPNASLIKPLIMQLLDNHFKMDYENDNRMIHEIKELVNTELNTRLTDSPILSVLSFLDPRFTHLLTSSEIEYVREFLRDKLEDNLTYDEIKPLKKHNDTNTTNGSSSSGLEFFFMLKKPKSTKTNKFDHEFDKFMNEAATSLEQCPITWWAEYGYFYPLLSQLAKIYTNIPACYLERHKIGTDGYFNFHRRRYLLDECTEKVLYLHLAEEYLPWIE